MSGWKQYERRVQAAAKREERQAVRMHRELQKQQLRDEAANEVAQYENYVALLVSIHGDCGDAWDWSHVLASAPPAQPSLKNRHEAGPRAQLESYVPGFFDKLFGGEAKKRAALQSAIEQGHAADQWEHKQAMDAYAPVLAHWKEGVRLAPEVLKLEPTACKEALAYAGSFEELSTFKVGAVLESIAGDAVALTCTIKDQEVVPKEEVKLSAGGKVSTKEMAAAKYWALYQDYVCSCALRVAREAFLVLPIQRAIVNVKAVRLNTSTGHVEPETILAVSFMRETLAKLNMAAIDPSDSMSNFHNKMKFKKTSGFETVEEMTFDEQWVTT